MTLPDMDVQLDREMLLQMRDGLLRQVDAIERRLAMSPRTAELRKLAKQPDEQGRKSLYIVDTD